MMINNSIKSLKILIVDGQEFNIAFLERILSNSKRRDYTIDPAPMLSLATGKLETNHYDIILLGMNLPDSNDLNTLQIIKQNKPSIPIIIITKIPANNDRRRLSVSVKIPVAMNPIPDNSKRSG